MNMQTRVKLASSTVGEGSHLKFNRTGDIHIIIIICVNDNYIDK
jgi:hypothetical protein